MTVIVAFGDSNTWGSDPATGGRLPRAQRWPTVMQNELGPGFEVVAEGLRGRTTVHDDPIEPYRSGAHALPPGPVVHQVQQGEQPLLRGRRVLDHGLGLQQQERFTIR